MFKKKTLGVQPKARTLDEINQDYNFHAAQCGHKARIIQEIQDEIDHHIERMRVINAEAKQLPPDVTKAMQENTALRGEIPDDAA